MSWKALLLLLLLLLLFLLLLLPLLLFVIIVISNSVRHGCCVCVATGYAFRSHIRPAQCMKFCRIGLPSDSQSQAANVQCLACIHLSAAIHSQEQTDKSSRRFEKPVVNKHVWKKQTVFSRVERTLQAMQLTVKIGHRYDAEPGVMQQPLVCKWVKIKVLQQHTAQHIRHEHLQAVSASTPCMKGHTWQVCITSNITTWRQMP